MDGRGGVGVLLELGYTFHYDTGSSGECSTGDRNKHNPQDKLRRLLVAVWHHTHPYWCRLLAPQALYCTLMVWQDQQKAVCECRLAWPSKPYAWYVWIVLTIACIALILSYELDFSSCAISDDFCKSSHIVFYQFWQANFKNINSFSYCAIQANRLLHIYTWLLFYIYWCD